MAGKAPQSPEQIDQALEAYWAQNPADMYAAMLRDPDAFGLNRQSATDSQTLLRAKYETGQLTGPEAEQFLRVHGSRTGVDPATLNPQQLQWAYGTGVPDANGMGNDGGQRTPTNTGPTPSNGAPGGGGPAWGDAGYTPPAAPPAGGTGGGGTTPPGTGGNAGTGGAGGAGGGLYGPPVPFGGHSGVNADFYARQFGNLSAGNDAFQQRQLAAALRREQEQSQQAEQPAWEANWDWADLPEVRTNVQQPGETQAYSWGLNSALDIDPGKTTNKQLVDKMAALGLLNESQFALMRKHWDQAPDTAADTNWATAGSPNALTGAIQGNLAPNFADALTSVFNNIYTRSDLATPPGGGPAAPPPGYAAPR